MNGNYYAIDIWGLIAALVMVAIAAGISETMRMRPHYTRFIKF